MAVLSRAVSVTTTATRLDSTDEGGDGIAGQSVAIYNAGAQTIYIGGPAVTTATGAPVPAGAWGPGMDLFGDALYGIVAATTCEARVFETGI